MSRLAALCAVLVVLGAPLAAQTADFGDDSSPFAHDGECDDPRFAGPGMTATRLLDSDIGADASDCRAAFGAGRLTLAGQTAMPVPGKGPATARPMTPAGLDLGDDSGDWPADGECDDRRFAGPGMAAALSWSQTGRDATDCGAILAAGNIRLWDWAAARAATDCSAISFGNDSGGYAFDGECDDMRFEGPGTASTMTPDYIGADATDCRQLCSFGVIGLRDHAP